jgi:hypothetical protein
MEPSPSKLRSQHVNPPPQITLIPVHHPEGLRAGVASAEG